MLFVFTEAKTNDSDDNDDDLDIQYQNWLDDELSYINDDDDEN